VRLRGAAGLVAAVGAGSAVSVDCGLVRGRWLRGVRHVVGIGLGVVSGVEEDVIGFECG
jgi:hypothetical protein